MDSATETYQLCCCCLELVCLKSLWRQYSWMDRTEVYGDMLRECFDLSWDLQDEKKDLICEVCITRLRNAVQFKQKVIQSQSTLKLPIVDSIRPLKEEAVDVEVLEHQQKQEFATEIVLKIEREDDCDVQTDDLFDKDDDDDLDNSDTTAIKAEKLTFKVGPVKVLPKGITVKRNIRPTNSSKRRKSTTKRKVFDSQSFNSINPRQNVALILEHSTIVPFKSRVGYFNCFYCNKQFAGFDRLKTHVSELHKNISSKHIYKSIYRPHDRIRADVSDINCRLCKKKIDNLDFLIQHLTDDHNVRFNFNSDMKKPADCILGYNLSEGRYRCCQCKQEFTFFKTLTSHMNEHSTDHVCDVCGRCFLLADRLRAHSASHKEQSEVTCDTCGKICGSKIILKSHIRYIHEKRPFMCSICDKTFNSSQKRVKHLEEVHNRAPLDLTCKICSKKFGHHLNLYRHMKYHSTRIPARKYGCSICGMQFSTNSGLASHGVVHSGEKNYECEVCHKKYGRRKTLTEHLRIHKNDRRFACGACSQAFVQKCSLKNHIKYHHGDVNLEKLIVDRKLNLK